MRGIERAGGIDILPAIDGLVGISLYLLAEDIALAVLGTGIPDNGPFGLEVVLEGVVSYGFLPLRKCRP